MVESRQTALASAVIVVGLIGVGLWASFPEGRALTPNEMVSATEVRWFQVSSDGARVAAVSTVDAGMHLTIAPLAGGAPRVLIQDLGVEGAPQWSPAGERITYISRGHLFVAAAGEGRPIQLTDDIEEKRVEDRSPRWSPDGTRIAFASNRGGSLDILLVDAGGGYATQLTTGPWADTDPSWSPDGKEIGYFSRRKGDLQVRAVMADGSGDRLIADLGNAVARDLSWSPDGSRVVWASAGTEGSFDLSVVPVKGGAPVQLTHDPHDEVSPAWSPDGTRIAFVRYNGFRRDLAITSLTPDTATVVAPAQAVRSSPQWLKSGSAIAFMSSSPTMTPDVWTVTSDGATLRQVTHSMGNVDPALLSTPDDIVYRSFDGLEIHALLFRPRGFAATKRYPALIAIHGGPSAQWDHRYELFFQYFAQRGYVVLAPNPRGSSGYGKAFEDMNNGDWGGGDLKDILAGDDYLKSLNYVDGERIGLWGGSYGGFLSYAAVTKDPGRFKASVVRAGMPNLLTSLREHTPEEHVGFAREAGDDTGLLEDRSAINFVDRVVTPMLIEIGLRDRALRVIQQREWVTAMRARGKTVEYVEYPAEGHGLARYKETVRDRLIRETRFYEQYLAGRTGPAADARKNQ